MGNTQNKFISDTMKNIKNNNVILRDKSGIILNDNIIVLSLKFIYLGNDLSCSNNGEILSPYLPKWWTDKFYDMV